MAESLFSEIVVYPSPGKGWRELKRLYRKHYVSILPINGYLYVGFKTGYKKRMTAFTTVERKGPKLAVSENGYIFD